MNNTIRWTMTLTARSSIAHGGDTRGTIKLLRRELVMQPDGTPADVPVISGNSLRGRLRRIGEELLRDQLQYEGEISPAAAHALRGGGALAKTSSEPLSGARLQRIRELVPHVGIFGSAGGGAIIDGALAIGKVVPHLVETAHITGVATELTAYRAVQLESYTRVDDTHDHDFADVTAPPESAGENRKEPTRSMLYQIETFLAGTTFSSWGQLRRPTELEASLLADILQTYQRAATLGGRGSIGHGLVDVSYAPDPMAPDPQIWRRHAAENRDEILAAVEELT